MSNDLTIHDCLADAQSQVGKAFAEYALNPSQATEAKFKEKYRALNQVALSANETKTLTLQDRLELAEKMAGPDGKPRELNPVEVAASGSAARLFRGVKWT
jgi:uncharacterized membrane protein